MDISGSSPNFNIHCFDLEGTDENERVIIGSKENQDSLFFQFDSTRNHLPSDEAIQRVVAYLSDPRRKSRGKGADDYCADQVVYEIGLHRFPCDDKEFYSLGCALAYF